MSRPTVRVLGTHGVPAGYGGFETAAENIARFLVRQGWRVVVYCQVDGRGAVTEDTWQGIERVHVPVDRPGWLGTSLFDLRSIRHASAFPDLCLTFGYNTAVFNTAQRLKRIPNVINMDGMEWTRARWGPTKQGILLANERIACRVGDHLIADHPVIHDYLRKHADASKITTITYGADPVEDAPTAPLEALDLRPGGFSTVICRPIPENSLLEIVRAYARRERRHRLVVLGSFDASTDAYHDEILRAASDEVVFAGAIYDPEVVTALRFHSRCYVHGHTVGGTNPSLVEAMAAANPVIAHDNVYNRWVAGERSRFFRSEDELASLFDVLLDDAEELSAMSRSSRERHRTEFTWEHVAAQYEQLLRRHLPGTWAEQPVSHTPGRGST